MVPGRFHTVGCVVPENSAHSGEVPTMQASVLSPFRLLPTRVNPCRLLTLRFWQIHFATQASLRFSAAPPPSSGCPLPGFVAALPAVPLAW
jgi:hypothetical protein